MLCHELNSVILNLTHYLLITIKITGQENDEDPLHKKTKSAESDDDNVSSIYELVRLLTKNKMSPDVFLNFYRGYNDAHICEQLSSMQNFYAAYGDDATNNAFIGVYCQKNVVETAMQYILTDDPEKQHYNLGTKDLDNKAVLDLKTIMASNKLSTIGRVSVIQ